MDIGDIDIVGRCIVNFTVHVYIVHEMFLN